MVPEPWKVEIASTFTRDLNKIVAKVQPVIVEFVTGVLPNNPKQMSKELRNELAGTRSAVRGDYRILFKLNESKKTIVLISVAHRSNVYRPRR